MKAIKLIIIFIVLLGGVVGAFFLLTREDIYVLPSLPTRHTNHLVMKSKMNGRKKETGTKSSSCGIANPSDSLVPSLKQAL